MDISFLGTSKIDVYYHGYYYHLNYYVRASWYTVLWCTYCVGFCPVEDCRGYGDLYCISENFSINFFCNTKAAGLCEIFIQQKCIRYQQEYIDVTWNAYRDSLQVPDMA